MSNYGFRILPAAKRPPAALLKKFKNVVAAHLSDSMGRLPGGVGLRPMHKGGHMLGVALTVRVPPGDNLMVHKAIDLAQPGDVIIVDAGGEVTTAIIGEIMSTHAAKRKVAGMVIDGAIRDAGALAKSAFPVYARGVSHRGPYKDGPGEINVPISVGGMVVNPGDIIVGDEDGIVAVPQAEAAELIDKAWKKAADEAETFRQIAKGTIDRSWVDKSLKAKGCDM